MSTPRESSAMPASRALLDAVPAEGENGLFSMSWYPICLSADVVAGQVIGCDFLDGRVIVMRAQDGIVQVMSAYCPHMGADLSVTATDNRTTAVPGPASKRMPTAPRR